MNDTKLKELVDAATTHCFTKDMIYSMLVVDIPVLGGETIYVYKRNIPLAGLTADDRAREMETSAIVFFNDLKYLVNGATEIEEVIEAIDDDTGAYNVVGRTVYQIARNRLKEPEFGQDLTGQYPYLNMCIEVSDNQT